MMCLAGAAHADGAADARAHYASATSHFAVGEFAQAADEYQEAYKSKPDPALLFNAAQSRRLASENDKALVLYKNYLALYPRSKNGADVREQIAKLEDAIAAAEKAKTSPPTGTVEPAKPENEPKETPPQVAVAPPPEQPHDQPAPVYKKWWLWTIVGVVVVAAVVVPVAVVTSSPAPWNNLPNQGPGAATLLVRW